MSDQSGAVIWKAEYKAWAECKTEKVKSSFFENSEIISNNIRFQGQYFDQETGLHYNRYRYYSTNVGRFVSKDPISLLGGNNLYKYASNPIEWVDPLGLSPNKNSKTKGNSATTNETNSCCEQDPCASLTDVQWSNHGNKHVPAPNLSWQKIIESTGHQGKAKYKPGVNIKALEMTAWSTGTKINAGAGKNSVWKVFKAPDIIGLMMVKKLNICV